jgi:3-oxoacyl-[acyl-carrier protein] reductase
MASAQPGWVVVSGAGGALGSAVARHFASTGRQVLGLDRDAIAAEGTLVTRQADLTHPQAVEDALAVIPGTERIALLVNAVGQIWNEPVLALKGGRFTSHDAATMRQVFDANLVAPFVTATAVAARMARGGGAIVNFSSIAAAGNTGQAAYSAAKAGIEGMTRAMAAELGPLNIRVNAIAPGFIDVATTRGALADKQLAQYEGRTPLGRLGAEADIINAVIFLETSLFVTGEILKVDGGLRL